MVDGRRNKLSAFRKRQAALRERQWARTIKKARGFTGIETLRQGIEFSEDLIRLRRRWQHGRR